MNRRRFFDGDAGAPGTWQSHLVQQLGIDACWHAIGLAALGQLSYSWASLAQEKTLVLMSDRRALRVLEAGTLDLFLGQCERDSCLLDSSQAELCVLRMNVANRFRFLVSLHLGLLFFPVAVALAGAPVSLRNVVAGRRNFRRRSAGMYTITMIPCLMRCDGGWEKLVM